MPKDYNLTLSSADVDIISEAIGLLPLNKTLSLWLTMKAQVSSQQLAEKDLPPATPVETVKEVAADGDDTANNQTS